MPIKELVEKILTALKEGSSLRKLSFGKEELVLLKNFQLLTLKPVLYVANVNENGFENNPHLDLILKYAKEDHSKARY